MGSNVRPHVSSPNVRSGFWLNLVMVSTLKVIERTYFDPFLLQFLSLFNDAINNSAYVESIILWWTRNLKVYGNNYNSLNVLGWPPFQLRISGHSDNVRGMTAWGGGGLRQERKVQGLTLIYMW
jgi:hypothetical protein